MARKTEREGDMQLRTRGRYLLGEITSALIKALRRGDEELALFFAQELEESFPAHTWKRLAIFTVEDIGLADAHAAVLVNALWSIYREIKEQQGKAREVEGDILSMAVLYLCRAPKARECDTAKNYMLERRAQGFKPPIPEYAFDCHTQKGKQLGKTETDWWKDDAWLSQDYPGGGYGKYEAYATLKKAGGSLPPEDSQA
jgi:replication-associated recombination protein RarA